MNFEWSDEQRMLQDGLRRFLNDAYDAKGRKAALEAPEGFSRETWGGLAEMGVVGALFPEDQGGFGGSGFDLALVFEEMGRAGAVDPLIDTGVLGGGLLAALWIRFNSGWIPIDPTKGVPSYQDMLEASLIATGVFLLTFRSLELFKRPHKGRFEDAIPRMIRAIGLGFILYLALEAALRLEPSFSRGALAVAAGTITFLVLLERYLIYRIEWNLARHMPRINRVLILGTDHLAIKLSDAIRKDPFLRADILGFLRTNPADDIEMEPDKVIGELADFEQIVGERQANEVILCDLDIGHEKMAHLIGF